MAKLPALSPEDQALWEVLKQEVRPLPGAVVISDVPESPEAPATEPRTPKAGWPQDLVWQAPGQFAKDQLRKATVARASDPSDLRMGRILGLDRARAERLRKGKMPIEGRIDLHGLTQDQAKAQLEAFVAAAACRGQRTLLVITGKGKNIGGQGVLRRRVPEWLGQGDLGRQVLAFSYAHRRDGDQGALYVLLRRPHG